MLDPEPDTKFDLDEKDIEIKTSRGSGPGGQHRNKTDSCVTATHKPSGVSVRIDMKSQHQSKTMALKVLAAKLSKTESAKNRQSRENLRQNQVGSGMRGDKIRTYRTQDDQVTDHRNNRTFKLKKWMKGDW